MISTFWQHHSKPSPRVPQPTLCILDMRGRYFNKNEATLCLQYSFGHRIVYFIAYGSLNPNVDGYFSSHQKLKHRASLFVKFWSKTLRHGRHLMVRKSSLKWRNGHLRSATTVQALRTFVSSEILEPVKFPSSKHDNLVMFWGWVSVVLVSSLSSVIPLVPSPRRRAFVELQSETSAS